MSFKLRPVGLEPTALGLEELGLFLWQGLYPQVGSIVREMNFRETHCQEPIVFTPCQYLRYPVLYKYIGHPYGCA